MRQTHSFRPATLISLAFLALVTLWLGFSSAAAAGPMPASITVLVENQPLTMDVPPIIVSDRTLVGARFVSEAVGAKVEWDPVNRQVIITHDAGSILLTIGNRTALVNGRPVEMEVPAQIVSDRTMVPLRFIAESLNYTVEWYPQSRTANILRAPSAITGLSYHRGIDKSTVEITLSAPLLSMEEREAGDSTVALDLYPAVIDTDLVTQQVQDSLLQSFGLTADGRTVRFEASLASAVPPYRTYTSDDGRQLFVEFDHIVTGVRLTNNGWVPEVEIATTGEVTYAASRLSGPDRLVLDFPTASLSPDLPTAQMAAGSPAVRMVRTGLQEGGGSRIVLELTGPLPYEIDETAKGLRLRFVPQIEGVTTSQSEGKTRLSFSSNLPVGSFVKLSEDKTALIIEVPQARSALNQSDLDVQDGAVESITVTSGTLRDSTLITVQLPYYLGHTVLSQDGENGIVLEIVNSPLYGKRIWVDAGHGKIPGGNDDPGTISRTYGVYEKELNLKVALALQEKLEEAGAIVFMTRTGDEGVDFRDRPAMVNKLDPGVDVFVSIHHNAASSASARGTETYYWSTNPLSKELASYVHAAVVESLGFPDRKVRTNSFWVIKETKAPSILVELGYLSSPDEEKAIVEPGAAQKTYPDRAAAGIVNGLFDYFWAEPPLTAVH